jgi:ubiquitin-protein ligase
MPNNNAAYTAEFGNKVPAFSYVFTLFLTNTYLNGTYCISKLSEKYKEIYSIKIIPVF